MQAVAQEDGQGSKVQVTGSIQSDILIPQADAKIGAEDYSEFALTNTFGEVNLSSSCDTMRWWFGNSITCYYLADEKP